MGSTQGPGGELRIQDKGIEGRDVSWAGLAQQRSGNEAGTEELAAPLQTKACRVCSVISGNTGAGEGQDHSRVLGRLTHLRVS